MPGKVALQRMKLPARNIRVGGACSLVELRQLTPQARRMSRLDACLAAGCIEAFDALVSKALYYGPTV